MEKVILEKIRIARLERNLSQQNMADLLSITQSSYAKIERGSIKLSIKSLFEISEYLNMNLPLLFQDCESKKIDEKGYIGD